MTGCLIRTIMASKKHYIIIAGNKMVQHTGGEESARIYAAKHDNPVILECNIVPLKASKTKTDEQQPK